MSGKKFFYLMSIFTAIILILVIIIATATDNTEANNKIESAVHYNMAKNLYLQKQYKQASDELLKALKLNSMDSRIFLELGKNYAKLDKIDDAVKSFKKSIYLDKNNIEAYINLAQIYNSQTKYSDSIKLLLHLKSSQNSEILSLLGEAEYKNNNISAAEDNIKKAILTGSVPAKNYNLLGLIYLRQGKASNAIMQFRKAIAVDKTFVEARCNLAKALWIDDKLNYAVVELENNINYNPDYPETYYLLGKIYSRNNLYQKANDNFIKIFEIDQAAISREMIEDIVKELENIAPKSQSASVYNTLAIAYSKLSLNDKAIMAYNAAIKGHINDALIYNNLASLYFQKNNISKAVYYYNKALKLSPNESIYYYDLGNCYKKVKNYKKAIYNYNKALKLNPSLNIARVTLADIYKEQGNLKTAKILYNQAIQKNSSEPYAYSGLSEIAEKQGNKSLSAKYKSLYLQYISNKKT